MQGKGCLWLEPLEEINYQASWNGGEDFFLFSKTWSVCLVSHH